MTLLHEVSNKNLIPLCVKIVGEVKSSNLDLNSAHPNLPKSPNFMSKNEKNYICCAALLGGSNKGN
jgi:hypothetical protein